MGRDRERSVRRLFERLRVPMTKRSRGTYFVTEAQYAELIEKMTTCSRSGVEAKTSISVARSVSGANIIKEHSCGTDRRDDAEAYRSKLEAEIRHEILYGSRGRTHTLTIADALLAYVKRPGGLRSYDLARIDEINRLVGDFTIAQAADAWTDFKRKQCAALSVVAVQRFRATFQAALNHLGREENFDVPALPKRSPHERKVKKRVRWLPSKRAHLLIFSYAAHVQPVAITLRWQGLRIGEALRVDWSARQLEGQFNIYSRKQERRITLCKDASQDADRIAPALGCARLADRGHSIRHQSRKTLPRSA